MIEVAHLGFAVPGRTLFSDLSVHIASGDMLAVIGPSGSGKTTLLHCINGLLIPREGEIWVDDVNISRMSASGRSAFRLRSVGMVFQDSRLLPELSVLQNVMLPLSLERSPRHEARHRAEVALSSVGLQGFGERTIDLLSGGELQRVAIARAIVSKPRVICADEPTGSLDEANALAVTLLLKETARALGASLVVATHDPVVYHQADSCLDLRAAEALENLPDSAYHR